MALSPDVDLLHYRLVEKLGEGGMGVVWKARDTSLDRQVAIKILPQEFLDDADRLARFEREAKLLAALNHPNIAGVFGFHEAMTATSGRVRFIAMELVEGVDLSQRLARGAMPLEEALGVAKQIADALEAAHEHGIIHRDLKPANIKLSSSGVVKVLDFGLAKAFEAQPVSGHDPSMSPTITSAGTMAGTLLGTAAYMSPEQARGHPVDARTDVFSFGAVLYEMLTGRAASHGETVTDTLAAVLKSDPEWAELPRRTPARVQRMLRRCLNKDRRARLQAIGDARVLLEEVLAGPLIEETDHGTAAGVPRWLPWALLAAMTLLAALSLFAWRTAEVMAPPQVTRATIELPEDAPLAMLLQGFAIRELAISPDGGSIVYTTVRTAGDDRRRQLVHRSLDSDAAVFLPGTEGGTAPFFSRDGAWLGFHRGFRSRLWKVPVAGGTPTELSPSSKWRGADWTPQGDLIVGGVASGLRSLPSDGGEAVVITRIAPDEGEIDHRLPFVLPSGKGVLFTIKMEGILDFDDAKIAVVPLQGGESRELIDGGTNPSYLPTGHLVFHHNGGLFAAPFDEDRLEVVGRSVKLVEDVAYDPSTGGAHYAVSETGTLIYASGGALRAESTLQWIDREGRRQPVTRQARQYMEVEPSPDGKKMVALLPAADNKLWLLDLDRDILSRLTYGPGNDFSPAWSPDGRWVYFNSTRPNEGPSIFRTPAEGGEETLIVPPTAVLDSISPDGRALAVGLEGEATGDDLWIVPTDDPDGAQPFLATEYDEYDAQFSPGGGWLAYRSDESGESEIYLRRFPGADGKTQVTSGGVRGDYRWCSGGREIVFISLDGAWVSVPVDLTDTARIGSPTVLFEQPPRVLLNVSPDCRQFLVLENEEHRRFTSRIRIVLNWAEEVRARTVVSEP